MPDKVTTVKVECRGCQAYLPVSTPPNHGQCRRHPPQLVGFLVPVPKLMGGQFEEKIQAHFPLVDAESGCMDFIPRVQPTGEEEPEARISGLHLVRR